MGKVKETKRRREKKPQQEGKIIHVCMAVKGFHIHCFLFLIVISVEEGALMIPTLQMKELRLRGVNGACFLSREVVESRFKTTFFFDSLLSRWQEMENFLMGLGCRGRPYQ